MTNRIGLLCVCVLPLTASGIGDHVALHQPIALSGNTGYTNTPHLHFAVFYPLDGFTRATLPVTFLPRAGDGP